MPQKTRYYRGWMIHGTTLATRGGTTIYGDSFADLKKRVDAWMAQGVRRGNL